MNEDQRHDQRTEDDHLEKNAMTAYFRKTHPDLARLLDKAIVGWKVVEITHERKAIVDLMGDLSRIELFARKEEALFDDPTFEGWDLWGNEVEHPAKEMGEKCP